MKLLEETLSFLEHCNKKPDDVRWVGSRDGKLVVDWASFELIAKDITYDSGFGAQKIASDLIVVGNDWWMSRSEYDGSEGWSFHQKPLPMELARPFNLVKVPESRVGWMTLNEINNPSEED
jgi:hypothetical protein